MEHPITPPPVGPARCLGSRSYEDGEWHWREGCDDCQRRIVRAGEGWITPPPIIAFECEYRIGPDEIVALEALLMTNLTPNDLSHLSDEEFLALCPQGEHAPGPEPLSPAAQAVLDAAFETDFDIDFANLDASIKATINNIAAAAIRALADQVVPPDPCGDDCCITQCEEIRAAILTIATELKGQ
jgi:hypothetical protein